MLTKEHAKHVLHKLGLFPVARALYRRISPAHRRERQNNKDFYGTLVRPGDLCFDVGANLGQSIEALVELGAKVIAVEPNAECLPVLSFHFGRDPNVRIVAKACGKAAGVAQLHYSGTDSTASLRPDWPFKNDESMSVEV